MNTLVKAYLLLSFLLSGHLSTAQVKTDSIRDKMLARAATFDLNTKYIGPLGDALSLNTAGYAKIMCSAIFITELTPEFADVHVGYFTSPYSERAKVGRPLIDYEKKTVSIIWSLCG